MQWCISKKTNRVRYLGIIFGITIFSADTANSSTHVLCKFEMLVIIRTDYNRHIWINFFCTIGLNRVEVSYERTATHLPAIQAHSSFTVIETRLHKLFINPTCFTDHARHLTKLQMRQATMDKLEVNREDDINNFVKFIMQPGQQRNLGMYLESLKKKSK